jgi:hypothetical protein
MTTTGWANLCPAHYEQRWSKQAADFCREHKLTTRAAQIAFIRERLSRFGQVHNPRKWIEDLEEKRARGESLSPIQIELLERVRKS